MAATGKTPILLYGSTTATNVPVAGNLTNSSDGCEIAINVADKNLFFKDSTNAVNTVPIRQSSASSNGWLSSTDWSTFNGKVSSQWTTSGSDIYYGTGNVGVGSAPKTWSSGVKAIDLGPGSAIANAGSNVTTWVAANAYYNSGWKYKNNYNASLYEIDDAHKWFVSTSGTANNAITFTQAFTISSAANVTVNTGNLVIGTSGKGIDFSVTSQAAGMTSELLSDYEEGTWTPTQGAGLTVTGTFASTGTYTKVGRQVTVTARLSATTISCSAGGEITAGLPFTPALVVAGGCTATSFTGSITYVTTTGSMYAMTAISSAAAVYVTATFFV